VLQRLGGDLDRGLVRRRQHPVPWAAVAPAEPEVEQKFEEVGVVACDVTGAAVVDRLTVVRLGPGLQQHPGEGQLVTVGRRGLFTATEDPGECGERRRQTVPEEAGVGIGAVLEQLPSDGDGIAPCSGGVAGKFEPGVREVEQRRPAERAAFDRCGGSIAGEDLAGRGDVADGGGREERAPRELRVVGDEAARPFPSGATVGAVVEAGEAEQLVGAGVVVDQRSTGRLLVRRPGQPVDQPDVPA